MMRHMVGRLDARTQHSRTHVHMDTDTRPMADERGRESSTTTTTRAYTTANRVWLALATRRVFFPTVWVEEAKHSATVCG